jgi:hypothetical protein
MSDLPAKGEHQGAFEGRRQAGLGASLLLPARFFSNALMLALLLRDRMFHGVAPSKHSSTPLLALLSLPLDDFSLSHLHAPLPHMPP